MYLNALTSHHQTEHDLKHKYTKTILELGDKVLNNFNFSLTHKIDRFAFIEAKTLSIFDNNLHTTSILFKPKVLKKLLAIPTTPQEQDIINNITQEINNNYPVTNNITADEWDAIQW